VLIAGDVTLDDTLLGKHCPRPYSCWRCVVYWREIQKWGQGECFCNI